MTAAVEHRKKKKWQVSDQILIKLIHLIIVAKFFLKKTTLEAANDKSFPTDARLIWYVVDGIEHIDLTRCSKVVKLFDMYYDKYGKGAVQKIDFGFGTVNPKLWGIKAKSDKKRK